MLERGVRGLTGQRRLYWLSDKRFIVVAAGGRSLKTEIAKRKLVKRAIYDPLYSPTPNGTSWYFFAGPTEKQARLIAWDDIQAMIPKEMIMSIDKSDLIIRLVNNAGIQIVGLDKPQRIEGHPWRGGVITEFADIKEGAWEANIRPLLSDYQGWVILEGRPDYDKPNNAKFKELFERGLRDSSTYNENWESFTWSSIDVLPEGELEEARATMSETMFRQEFEGSFVSAPGRAYPEYSRNVHVRNDIAVYDPSLPLRVSCDFNAEHHNWGLYQVSRDNKFLAIDQIYLVDGRVEHMIRELESRIESMQPRDIVFYGDYSGRNRSAPATFDSWTQIRDAFPRAEMRYMKQPPIVDRINRVNGALRNAKGEVRTYINSKCVNLIKDFEEVTRSMLFSQNKSGHLTHASDNFGYFVCQYE